ncbi:signal transduction histidine kinase [Salana multivorans]|uniref:Signal transduction histidine-protein kinase/phosphatase MprB n=1 Tax=Salana multivorans TaxID=120377 RepID=A0A3N2D7L8_9MICO|nr:ATP-binding protein [Salana multivorans]OJX98358.1 MAG: two-component sensor histidine kinase [Micrococcales bacterium 73-15]ROR95770.1 signal transduction histidine kinase [Salana multivorans]
MQRRFLTATIAAVVVAVLLVGVPAAILSALTVRSGIEASLEVRAQLVARLVERRVAVRDVVTEDLVAPLVSEGNQLPIRIEVTEPRGNVVIVGPDMPEGRTVTREINTTSGANVLVSISGDELAWRMAQAILLVTGMSVVAIFVAVGLARWQARRLAAPLLLLAASAEQLGSGQVRPRMADTGIEEIDLVAAELGRTSDRLAARLAAERQFSSDASHQLRTPLTALSMRLEEIQLLSEQEDVREEARISLEQVERLVGVVDDLLSRSRKAAGGTTGVVALAEVFAQQEEEWGPSYGKAGRSLVFSPAGSTAVLATPGALAQVLATLLENSLKYGDGTTRVSVRPTTSRESVVIEVSDEGAGVAPELAPRIFERSVSGGKSTGLGLALARDLVASDGGKLELVQAVPAVFQIFLSAAPGALDPARVLPPGALVAVGRRRRRP